MSDRLQTSFDVLGAGDNADRFILVGSMGRAALLEDTDFRLQIADIERDVDVVDMIGLVDQYYTFSDAAPIDGIVTKRLRPITGGDWGLYDPAVPGQTEPEIVLPAGLVAFKQVALPFAAGKMLTFDACTQLALRNISRDFTGYNFKHWRQYAELCRQDHAALNDMVCHCSDWKELMSSYYNHMMAKRPPTGIAEQSYIGVRWMVRQAFPYTFKHLQKSGIGHAVRQFRGTVHPPKALSIHEMAAFMSSDADLHL